MAEEWDTINVAKSELDLDLTLSSGLVFSWGHVTGYWREPEEKIDEWKGFIKDK